MNIDFIKNKFYLPLFFFPLIHIIGIAVVEIYIIFYLIFLLLHFKKNEFLENKILIILFLFSIYLGLNAFLQIPSSLKYSSIFHFRYVFFAIAVCLFFENFFYDKSNKKLLLFLFFMVIIILIFDSFFQFFVGENIFGQKLFKYRVSSFFGDDLILGGFLIRLLPIIFWYLFYIKIDINQNKILFTTFFSIYFFTIYLSGERTSFALLIIFIFLSLIFISNLRKVLTGSSIIFFIFILLNAFFNFGKTDITHRMFAKTYKQVFEQTIIQKNEVKKEVDNFQSTIESLKIFSSDHQGHLIVAKELFKESPIYGVGPKGFRHYCRSVDYAPEKGVCSTHSHNILAQTLSELGLIGFIFYLTFLIFLIKNSIIVAKKNINNFYSNSFLIISIGLLIHLFPFLPSGNFFNNWISSFIYFKVGLLLFSYKKLFS